MRNFYNSDGVLSKYYFKENDVIDVGSTGKIYRVSDDVCLKTIDKYKKLVNFDVLLLINNLKLKNFYEIYDFLYNKNNKIVGYTMKYYNKEDIDIFTMPTSYLLDNLYNIYNSIKKLSEFGVMTADIRLDNLIINRSGITVIDVDFYFFSNKDFNYLLESNIFDFGLLFYSVLYDSAERFYPDYFKCYEEVIEKLILLSDSFSSFDRIFNELDGYKYPIDYIKKHIKMR